MKYFQIFALLLLSLPLSATSLRPSNTNDENKLLKRHERQLDDAKKDIGKRRANNRVSHLTNQMKEFYKYDKNNPKPEPIIWADVVVVMLIYDNVKVKDLIQAALSTWIQRAGEGLDVVFVTDIEDTRTPEEILPTKDGVRANLHIVRSSRVLDGKRARAKVMDALFYVENKYKNTDKKYFLKVDPDSYVRPGRLMKVLNEINEITHGQPANFGYSICQTETCYSEGGLYGMSKEGLTKSIDYVKKNPGIFSKFLPTYSDDSRNILFHEDYFSSYIYWQATQYPVVFMHDISVNLVAEFRTSKNPVSIHPVKSTRDYYVLDMMYYDEKNQQRDPKETERLLKPFLHLFEFTNLRWDVAQEKYVNLIELNQTRIG